MRWKQKVPPKVGKIRERYKFAWLPTKVREYTVWLETFSITEKYTRVVEPVYAPGLILRWEKVHYKWQEIYRDVVTWYY